MRATSVLVASVFAMCLLAPTGAHADTKVYAREQRVAHLAAAIDGMTAMGEAGRRAFEVAVYEAVRTTCRPGNRAAPTTCLIAAARDVCARGGASAGGASAQCLAVADVVITNQHAEKALLDDATRMQLVRASADYHLGVIAALEARWAVLAAELALVAPEGTLAARIDRMCAERDRVVRPCAAADANAPIGSDGSGGPTCVGTIAYQRCAAGLVWFTSGARSKP